MFLDECNIFININYIRKLCISSGRVQIKQIDMQYHMYVTRTLYEYVTSALQVRCEQPPSLRSGKGWKTRRDRSIHEEVKVNCRGSVERSFRGGNIVIVIIQGTFIFHIYY